MLDRDTLHKTLDERVAAITSMKPLTPEDYGITNVSCGFYCPQGWERHVKVALEAMIEHGWNKDLHQVKEKFGGLRIYIGAATPVIYSIIEWAESCCWDICISCGVELTDTNTQEKTGYNSYCTDCKHWTTGRKPLWLTHD